ncbi:MAG: acylphosphatase [Chloroflexi bacterium]|nr:acylphosphatase [Chloroflexota bacterium]
MQRLHAIVSGRVQGVSFRYYTTQTARQLNIVGWVKNLPDRTVEVVAEGEKPALEQLLDFLHKGPFGARVTGVDVHWQLATEEFSTFRTAYE